jgi:hypothetical protein
MNDRRECGWYYQEDKPAEKRETHNVVPMHMRHKEIVGLRLCRPMFAHEMLAEAAQAGSHVANGVEISPDDFHAGRVAAVAVAQGEVQLGVDESFQGRVVVELPAIGFEQSIFDFLPDYRAVRPHWKRTASAPKCACMVPPRSPFNSPPNYCRTSVSRRR